MLRLARAVLCCIIGHDAGRVWYWDPSARLWYRDWRYCDRCGRNL
jgi:hypothetical protein